jgi:hypothetical protein
MVNIDRLVLSLHTTWCAFWCAFFNIPAEGLFVIFLKQRENEDNHWDTQIFHVIFTIGFLHL